MTLWRYLLPIRPGESVLVHGLPPPSVAALRGAAVRVTEILPGEAPPIGPVDHAIVVTGVPPVAVAEPMMRSVRPGGSVALALRRRHRLDRLRPASAQRLLARAEVETVEVFGIGDPCGDPPLAVPLRPPAISRWFAGHGYIPWSRAAALAAEAARFSPGGRSSALLFPGTVMIGRRHGNDGGQR